VFRYVKCCLTLGTTHGTFFLMLRRRPESESSDVKPRIRFGFLPQLRRDLGMLWMELRGGTPAPFIPRHAVGLMAASANDAPRATGIVTRKLRVARVQRETAAAVTLFLEDPSGAALTWEPGQFFTLLVPLETGETLRRAYSACLPPGQGPLPHAAPVTIKRVAGGRVSNLLNDHVREGDHLEVLGPSGSFTLSAAAAGRELVLIGGGSGITPLAAILRAALADQAGPHVTLLYGNRGEADVIFRAELDGLAARYPERFTLRHVLSEPPAAWSGGSGLLDQATTTRELAALSGASGTAEYFVCGPTPMMDAVRAALLARGVPTERLHEEKFGTPGAGSEGVSADDPALRAALAVPQAVVVKRRGSARTITAAPGQTLLEAGLAAGLPMPYSCAMGGCGKCKVQLQDGTTFSEEAGCLTRAERGQGYVLACISRASSPCTVEVPEER